MNVCPFCRTAGANGAKQCSKCGRPLARATDGEALVNRTIGGKFRIEELIGEGGMGKVYRAIQLSLDKTVALKVLHRSLLSDARIVARFKREAKAASRLNHPNSINIIDFGQGEDGSLYIAMEYVAGRDLQQLLAKEGRFPEKRIIKIFSQVLSALGDAHAAGVIHRDLKPENIMIEQRRGEPDFVKVLDFGIAKLQEGGQSLTRAGFVCGTPEYMSPEQGRGLNIDARSDVYSVGVVAYQCATGALPFENESPIGLAAMHLEKSPTPPRQKCPQAHISRGLEALILRALAKEPEQRPASAEDFRQELLALDQASEAADRQPRPRPAERQPSNNDPKLSAGSSAGRTEQKAERHRDAGDPASKRAAGSVGPQARSVAEESLRPAIRAAPEAKTLERVSCRRRKASSSRLRFAIAVAAILAAILATAAAVYVLGRHLIQSRAEREIFSSSELSEAGSAGAVAERAGYQQNQNSAASDSAATSPVIGTSVPADAPAKAFGSSSAADKAPPPPGGIANSLEIEQQELMKSGDQALSARDYESALAKYLKAYNKMRSAALEKRLALVHLLKNDPGKASVWLQRYVRVENQVDAVYMRSYLQQIKKKRAEQ